ncbi:hypothetical protein UFOVP247_12 [uncultured Caudovirales phage]|uniref:Uncharacterized protein n=1 Tax=uncultured Caudovirales phage TaxID=2100421 RepID=A0A6J7X038_9CAUD|nr:hypothetical protein UFOVP247_12 [uncultured Caudovirales phage]
MISHMQISSSIQSAKVILHPIILANSSQIDVEALAVLRTDILRRPAIEVASAAVAICMRVVLTKSSSNHYPIANFDRRAHLQFVDTTIQVGDLDKLLKLVDATIVHVINSEAVCFGACA